MLSLSKHSLRCAALLVLVAVVGCDSGPTIVPVAGTLTYKGHPVPNAIVFFFPDGGNGRPSQGPTDAEGRFKLAYTSEKDGVMAGKHRVWVTASRLMTKPSTAKEQEAAIMGKKPPMTQDMAAFFDKYGEKKSTVEVVIDKNTKELKLDWD